MYSDTKRKRITNNFPCVCKHRRRSSVTHLGNPSVRDLHHDSYIYFERPRTLQYLNKNLRSLRCLTSSTFKGFTIWPRSLSVPPSMSTLLSTGSSLSTVFCDDRRGHFPSSTFGRNPRRTLSYFSPETEPDRGRTKRDPPPLPTRLIDEL